MKLILAIVRPFKVAELVDAAEQDARFPGMTVFECRGFGREESASPGAYAVGVADFVEGAAILVAAPNDQVDAIVRRLERVAHTGRPGDGKLFILPLDNAVRLATGERNESALR